MSSLFFLSICGVKKNFVEVRIEYQAKESEYYFQNGQKDICDEEIQIEENTEELAFPEEVFIPGDEGEDVILSQPTKDIIFSSSFEISCSLDPFRDFVLSGFLPIFLGFIFNLGVFKIFKEHFQMSMKEIKYSYLQKVATLISSIGVGCEYIHDINDKLLPYPSLAGLLDMERFPDQSQINRFLRRIGVKEVLDISLVFELLLKEYGICMSKGKVSLNIDSTGLVVYGDTYEFKAKGYFPKQRGKEGYQLSLCSTDDEFQEVLSVILDPGNIPLSSRLFDSIYQAAEVLGDLDRIGVLRIDGIFGSGANVEALLEEGFSFIVKGMNPRTAFNLAQELVFENWYWVNSTTEVAEIGKIYITNCKYPVRTIVMKEMNAKGKWIFRHLYTSISPKEMDCVETFICYNERQGIESLIKGDKNGLYITNLRTRSFFGIEGFLYFAFITHNLLSLFRKEILKDTGLEHLGIEELTKKLMNIPAKFQREGNKINLIFPLYHRYSRAFIEGKLTSLDSS